MGGASSAYGGGAYRVLVGKPEGKKQLRRPRRRWENNIKMDFWKWYFGVCTGLSYLKVETSGGHS
jgi:hypothetical protein